MTHAARTATFALACLIAGTAAAGVATAHTGTHEAQCAEDGVATWAEPGGYVSWYTLGVDLHLHVTACVEGRGRVVGADVENDPLLHHEPPALPLDLQAGAWPPEGNPCSEGETVNAETHTDTPDPHRRGEYAARAWPCPEGRGYGARVYAGPLV